MIVPTWSDHQLKYTVTISYLKVYRIVLIPLVCLLMAVVILWFVCSLFVLSVSSDIQQDVEKLMNRIETLEQSHIDLVKTVTEQHDIMSKYQIEMERLTGGCGNDKLQTGKSNRENFVAQKRLSGKILHVWHKIYIMFVYEIMLIFKYTWLFICDY